MNPHPNIARTLRRATAAIFAAAALVAIAPAPAQAGCRGHAVAPGGDSFVGLDELMRGDALGDAGSSLPNPSSPAPRCSGAFCSGSPAVPSSSTVAPVPSPGQWAALIEAFVVDAPGPRLFLPGDLLLIPSSAPAPIFHPPRIDAATSL